MHAVCGVGCHEALQPTRARMRMPCFAMQWMVVSVQSSLTGSEGCWPSRWARGRTSGCRGSRHPTSWTSARAPAPSTPSPVPRVSAARFQRAHLLAERLADHSLLTLEHILACADLQMVNMSLRILSKPDEGKLTNIFKVCTLPCVLCSCIPPAGGWFVLTQMCMVAADAGRGLG